MKAFCNICNGRTNHRLLEEVERKYEDEVNMIFTVIKSQIIECEGCNDVIFCEEETSNEFLDPETGEQGVSVKYYPQRDNGKLKPKDYYETPRKLRNIYREMINAFNNELLVLCAGGLRAIVEGICNEQGIIDGPISKTGTKRSKVLQGKIGGLFEKGIITSSHADILHEFRFMGNEALHSLEVPHKDELRVGIEIITHTLDSLYELPEKAEELKERRQRRKNKKK